MTPELLYVVAFLLFWGCASGATSALLILPYVLLRKAAAGENWREAILHAYLPWLATALAILGILGIG